MIVSKPLETLSEHMGSNAAIGDFPWHNRLLVNWFVGLATVLLGSDGHNPYYRACHRSGQYSTE